MKNILLCILLTYSNYSLTMENSEEITPKEDECFLWFDSEIIAKSEAYKNLSIEDQAVYSKRLAYSEYPKQVTNAIQHYAEKFSNFMKEANQPLNYDVSFLSNTLLKIRRTMQDTGISKPTNITSARMYVFTQLLTKEEQQSVLKDNYLKNPEAAHQAMEKCGKLLAMELIKLNIIEDTPELQSNASQKFTLAKINSLKKAYCPQEKNQNPREILLNLSAELKLLPFQENKEKLCIQIQKTITLMDEFAGNNFYVELFQLYFSAGIYYLYDLENSLTAIHWFNQAQKLYVDYQIPELKKPTAHALACTALAYNNLENTEKCDGCLAESKQLLGITSETLNYCSNNFNAAAIAYFLACGYRSSRYFKESAKRSECMDIQKLYLKDAQDYFNKAVEIANFFGLPGHEKSKALDQLKETKELLSKIEANKK